MVMGTKTKKYIPNPIAGASPKRVLNPNWKPELGRKPPTKTTQAKQAPTAKSSPQAPIALGSLTPEESQTETSPTEKSGIHLSSDITAAPIKGGEKEYKEFLEDALPLFTWLVGLLIGFVLFRNVSIGEAIFTMQEAEVNALAGPVASLLAKQKLPARIKKIIVSSNDAIAIVAAGGVYCKRVATQLGEVINELQF